MKHIKLGLLISGFTYIFLVIVSFILNSKLDDEFISKWGLGLGIIMIISLLPLHRFLFFGSRPTAPNWVPTDEHLYHKMTRDYEVDKDKEQNPYKWVLVVSGVITISIALITILFN